MKRTKIMSIIVAAALSASMLAGCATTTATTTTAAAATAAATTQAPADTTAADTTAAADSTGMYKEATLTLLIDTDATAAGLEAVCALAKEKLGITVTIETRPGGSDGDNIVKTRLASGDMADLCIYNSGALLSALNPSEYFIDLSGQDFMSRIDDTYKGTVTIGSATYGVPFSSTQAGAILYNKEMYAKYNLTVPKTWDEFIANCQVLKDAGETALIGAFADSWTSQVAFLGDNYNVTAAAPTFAADLEAGTAKYATTPSALRSWEKLAETTPFYNKDYLATTYDDACDMIANGDGAQWVILTQALSNIYELYGKDVVDNIGVFAIPGDDAADNGLTVWMPSSIYGNKNSDKVDDILRFMEFYVSDEALNAYAAAILPDGPYCVKGYSLPAGAYQGVAVDMQAYFDAGKTGTALEFQTSVKGSNCPSICQECGSGQTTGAQAAAKYDEDCYKQAIQLGLNWAE